jgi:hypothetical protein
MNATTRTRVITRTINEHGGIPQQDSASERDLIIAVSRAWGLDLSPSEFGAGGTIDGQDPWQWLDAMTMD